MSTCKHNIIANIYYAYIYYSHITLIIIPPSYNAYNNDIESVGPGFKLDLECPHTSSSLPISNPIISFEDLDEYDREDIFAQMNEFTKKINIKFKKLLSQVFESLTEMHVNHESVVLTLTQDDVMVFDENDTIGEAKDMFAVFKAIRPYCSYYNYDLLQLIIEVHGSTRDKESLEEYIKSFTAYCEAMPCAEEICGNDDCKNKRIRLRFKLDFDRQRLKVDYVKSVTRNIARILKIKSCSLYLRSITEGCVLLEFLVSSFLFHHIFPLNVSQKSLLYEEGNVISIQCDCPNLYVVSS